MAATVFDLLRIATTDADTYFDRIVIENREFPVSHQAFIEITEAETLSDVEDLGSVDIPNNTAHYLNIPASFFEEEDLLEYGDELTEYHKLVEELEQLLESGVLSDPVHVFKVTQDETLVINGDLFGE